MGIDSCNNQKHGKYSLPSSSGLTRGPILTTLKGMKKPAVYILTNKERGTLYIGVTSNLIERVHQHRTDSVDGFSKQYKTHRLVYFEQFDDMYEAIKREKQLKKWKRIWKLELIEKSNPGWKDLYDEIVQ